jgi:tripartite-type tricarboxylate transporter receptor subunit TctC
MKKFHKLIAVATAAACTLLGGSALAQSDKSIRILVGVPAGGSLDALTRVVADKMKDELKQPVVVENKPGAGTRLAAELLKNAAPDGTTYLMTPIVTTVLAPLVASQLNYNPRTDFVPVGVAATFNFGLAVRADHPAKTVAELVDWFKTNPAKANFGYPAAGSLPHFFGLLVARESKADIVQVPFNGGAPLLTALLSDQVSMAMDTNFEWLSNTRAGKLRVLATSGAQRSKALPDVPTFKEQGYPNIIGGGWFALYAPAKTPEATIKRMNAALNKALANPEVIEKLSSYAMEPGAGGPADLAKLMDTDTARWAPIIKASGFKESTN